MKRVSFKVAKAIKEAGYPQKCDMYYPVPPKEQNIGRKVAQPTYIDVWFWLWREKGIQIDLDYTTKICSIFRYAMCCKSDSFEDPEEAIIEAIEYLVDNNLIKQ